MHKPQTERGARPSGTKRQSTHPIPPPLVPRIRDALALARRSRHVRASPRRMRPLLAHACPRPSFARSRRGASAPSRGQVRASAKRRCCSAPERGGQETRPADAHATAVVVVQCTQRRAPQSSLNTTCSPLRHGQDAWERFTQALALFVMPRQPADAAGGPRH